MSNLRNPIAADIKGRILSMIDEADALDYSVIHTVPKDAAVITVWRSVTRPVPTREMVITLSATSNMLCVKVTDGTRRREYMGRQYFGGAESEADRDKVMATITEFIENMDNGCEVTGEVIKA